MKHHRHLAAIPRQSCAEAKPPTSSIAAVMRQSWATELKGSLTPGPLLLWLELDRGLNLIILAEHLNKSLISIGWLYFEQSIKLYSKKLDDVPLTLEFIFWKTASVYSLFTEGERPPCPKALSDQDCPIEQHQAIEVGHTFYLGTKYSKMFDATFKDVLGKHR